MGKNEWMETAGSEEVQRGRTKGKGRWRRRLLIGGLAFFMQAGILGMALLIGVIEPVQPREARLKPADDTAFRNREQRALAEKQLAQLERLEGNAMQQLTEPLLEAMRPDIPVYQPDIGQSIQAMGAMLPAGSFFQSGMEGMVTTMDAEALPAPEAVEFLGESLSARRMILLIDVSASVKSKIERAGLSMEQLRTEMLRFIDQLGPNHLFGIVQFSRKWEVFREELVPATQAIAREARDWIRNSFRTTGTSGRNWSSGQPNGIEGVLQTAFAMDPAIDEIFLISDGDFQRTPPGGGGQDVPWTELRKLTADLQESSMREVRFRGLFFYPPEEHLADLRAWIKENGDGSLRIRAD